MSSVPWFAAGSQDALMFDPVKAPSFRHAFELVNAAILEADTRLRH
jgi:hypothetical protein